MRISDWSSDVCSSDLVVVRDEADLVKAEALRFPLVAKALPEHAEHKTELGLVKLGLASPSALRAAIGLIRDGLGMGDAPVLVQETAEGVAAVLSVLSDPDFGPVLALGRGGGGVGLWDVGRGPWR